MQLHPVFFWPEFFNAYNTASARPTETRIHLLRQHNPHTPTNHLPPLHNHHSIPAAPYRATRVPVRIPAIIFLVFANAYDPPVCSVHHLRDTRCALPASPFSNAAFRYAHLIQT